jgi:hypothetical protein
MCIVSSASRPCGIARKPQAVLVADEVQHPLGGLDRAGWIAGVPALVIRGSSRRGGGRRDHPAALRAPRGARQGGGLAGPAAATGRANAQCRL